MASAVPMVVAGAEYRAPYPFIRTTYQTGDNETGPHDEETWAPGTRMEQVGPELASVVADAVREIVLTVVSTHKPGRYPERVFFTRKWVSPDGRVFGNGALRIAITAQFRRLAAGYRHDFILVSREAAA